MKFLLLTFIILTTWYLINSQTVDQSSSFTNYRLPTNVHPETYFLYLKTYLPGYAWKSDERNLTFEGVVDIRVNISKATDKIVLHLDSLEIITARFESESCKVNISKWENTPELQFLTLFLNETVQPHDGAKIVLAFRGKLRTDQKGYYITESTREDGEKMLSAVTQFEPTSARFMVPCFDEPEFKATWKVFLDYPTGSVALTNTMENESTDLNDEFTVTVYEQTVKMSSYLLAVFVGDAKYKEVKTDKGVRIRVYADPENIDRVDHALNISRVVVEGFEKHFEIDYPFKKLDFLCVHNFAYGAMENWGLIVHKAKYLLGASDDVTGVVIHETAHQWFGNLVTMKFWDQLWLNEGFATYMTGHGFTFLDNSYNRDFSYVYKEQFEAQEQDTKGSLNSMTRKNNGEINTPQINYDKGAAFIRMLEKIAGTESFNKAINWYLSQNKYSNVEDKDLYEALNNFVVPPEIGLDRNLLWFEEFSRCWTHQNGYPTVYVESKNGSVTLTQRMEVQIDPDFKNFDECGYKWDIPIWYQEAENANIELTWFSKDESEIQLNVQEPVIINANSNGYYDVVYSDDLYQSIVIQLKSNSKLYSDSTKMRLLRDTTVYALKEKVSIHNAVIIAELLARDENKIIKSYAINALALVQARRPSLIEGNGEDVKIIETILAEAKKEELFAKCESSAGFSRCYKKTFKTEKEACVSIETSGNEASTDRLMGWLRTEKSVDNRETIIRMLSCGDEETFKTIVADENFNWTANEKKMAQSILYYFELIKKEQERLENQNIPKSRKMSRSIHSFSSNNLI